MVELEEVKRYRGLAARARRIGDRAFSAATKATYEDIALQYETLADYAGALERSRLN
jgi:hypothetical protein